MAHAEVESRQGADFRKDSPIRLTEVKRQIIAADTRRLDGRFHRRFCPTTAGRRPTHNLELSQVSVLFVGLAIALSPLLAVMFAEVVHLRLYLVWHLSLRFD